MEVLLTTKRVKLVGKTEFAAIILNLDDKTFIIHLVSITNLAPVHFSCKAQITSLKVNKVSIAIQFEYVDFIDVFFSLLTLDFSEQTGVNDYVINMINAK